MKKWRVLILDTKKINPNHYICLAIKEAFSNDPRTERIINADYGNAIARARENQCNLFVAFDGEQLDKGICERVAAICGLSVLWVTEDPYEISINKQNAAIFDLVFTNDSASVSQYGHKGRHLPFAASQTFHFNEVLEYDKDYRYDIFFAGTAWPNRVTFIKQLQKNLSGLKLKLALPYNEHLDAPDIGIAPSSYLWKTPNSEFARIANKSRAVLTLHRTFSSSGNAPTASTPGPRLFEVALAGGFQLVDMSIPETTRYFEDGKEIIGFNNSQECIEKLRYFLAHPIERVALAKAAQSRAQSEHLYSNRINEIYDAIESLPRKEPAVLETQHRRRVLFVTHNVIGVQPFGGVEVYQHLIVGALLNDFEILIYAVDQAVLPLGRRYHLYNEKMEIIESHVFSSDISINELSCPDREKRFSGIVTRHFIDLVHFQHLIGHVPSLPFITKALGIQTVASLHDYYAVCSHFNLIGYKGSFCNIDKLTIASCDVCLNAQDNAATGSQAARRAFFARALRQVDVLHANTEGVASLYESIFPGLRSRNQIQVFGVPMPTQPEAEEELPRTRPAFPLNVAIIGNFTRIKGGDIFIHTFNQMRNEAIKFHIFGTVCNPFDAIMNKLAFPNVEIHGGYSAGTLAEKLKEMSLSLHMSIWPETFCITLSEAWSAGLVPIVADIGALGERVKHGKNGFKVPVGEPGSVVSILRKLISDPQMIEEIRVNLTPALYVTNYEHMNWLRELYKNLLLQAPKYSVTINRTVLSPVEISLSDCGIVLNRKNWFLKTENIGILSTAPILPKGRFSHLHRFIWYVKSYGISAALSRAFFKIKRKLRIPNKGI